MNIELSEVKSIIKEVWNKLYFNSYGAYRDGIEAMKDEIENELFALEEKEGKKIAENHKEAV